MKEDVISFSSEDFSRLKKLIDSREYGFPVLAMHSLVEREIARVNGYDYSKEKIEYTFAELCRMLPLTKKQKDIINEFTRDRNDYANYVRHGFKNLTPIDASMIENKFFDFVHVFNPAAERLKEYKEVQEAVRLALSDKKLITMSEDRYIELCGSRSELRSTRADLDEAIRKYNEEHTKVESLNKELSAYDEKYKADIKVVNDKYDKKRRELFDTKQASEKKLSELERLKDTELKDIQAKHDAEIANLIEEKEIYLSELEKSRKIVDFYDLESQYYAYSEGRRSFIKTMMRLSPQQRKLVDSISLSSDFLIKGGAGSGKTLVLLAILKRLNDGLFDGMGHTCRLLTFTNTLTYFSKIIMPEIAQTSGLDIRTVNSLLFRMTKTIWGRGLIFDDRKMAELTPTLRENPDYVQEIRLFIWAKNIDKMSYLGGCERRGMKEGIGVKDRQKIWSALEELESVLKRDDVDWPVEYAVVRHLREYDICPEKYNEFACDYTLVDEYQDLSMATLCLLKKISNIAMYLAGDDSQSIFKKAMYTLKEIGISIEGRTRILEHCFRSTRQINAVCRRYRDEADVKTLGKDVEEDGINIRSGLPVSLETFETSEECLIGLLSDVRALLLNVKVPAKDICIIVYTKDQRTFIQNFLEENEIKTTIIDANRVKTKDLDSNENNIFESDSVKIMTIHSAKGLEFPCVLFYGKEDVSHKGINNQSLEKLKRDLVYVALTRACSILHIFYDRSTNSEALDLLDQEINLKPEPNPVESNDVLYSQSNEIGEYSEEEHEEYPEDEDENYLEGDIEEEDDGEYYEEEIGEYYEEFGCSQEEMDDFLENCAENAE